MDVLGLRRTRSNKQYAYQDMSAYVTCNQYVEMQGQVNHLESRINSLAKFLMAQYPDEIGKTDSPEGEGAIECAIRLLKRVRG